MAIPISTLKDVGAGVVLLGLGAWTAWGQWKDKRIRKKYGLAPNPERCADHEARLIAVESAVLTNTDEVALLGKKVDGLRKVVMVTTIGKKKAKH
jgi:hypothetical protein